MKSIVFLFLIFLLGCNGILADDKSNPAQKLGRLVEQKMLSSNLIVVQHIPNISIGNRLWEASNIQNDWDYKLTKKCIKNCGGRRYNLLAVIISSSTSQEEACPLPLNSLISLVMNDGKSSLDIYFHQSGHCFVIGGQSYYSDIKFNPLEDFRKL